MTIMRVGLVGFTLTDGMKADVIAHVEREIRRHCGMPKAGSGGDLWTTITEVPDGA